MVKNTAALFFLLLVFCRPIYSSDKLQRNLWYGYAQAYIAADERMIENASKKKGSFFEDYNLRYNAELKLVEVSSPSVKVLKEMLNSKDSRQRKVALVTVMIKKIDNKKLFGVILKNYVEESDFFSKFYSLLCFKSLGPEELRGYESSLIHILSEEKDEGIVVTGLSLLIKLDPLKTKPLFVRYLKAEDKGLRRASYIIMSTQNRKLHDLVMKQLRKDKDNEALSFIRELEAQR